METWFTAIGDYSFAVVISFYLLYRMEKKLDTLIKAVENMTSKLSLHSQSTIEPQESSKKIG
ncbi:YvrJ family protein [Thalassobacillus sp. C254]|uniref:YvrJ family protein n=1 Tax=Thalassobacillus sp. C254 TaxID=1225341 RepID=UPI0006D17E49|nr:YvrJ family protein [Thalassobacillus sp. C254]